MNKPNFTPGPWRRISKDIISEPTGKIVADYDLPVRKGHIGIDEAIANGRLMAAAPRLLEELETLCARLDEVVKEGKSAMWDIALLEIKDARAALAKARGE